MVLTTNQAIQCSSRGFSSIEKIMMKQGFSMVEVLVVLLIIGILGSIAAPLYLNNIQRARVAEAVAVLVQIRAAERDRFARTANFQIVINGGLAGDPVPGGVGGLNINPDPAQYFSMSSYAVAVPGAFGDGSLPVDFVITANGAASAPFVAGAGARRNTEVSGVVAGPYTVQMDNAGRIIYQVTAGGPWETY